MEQLRFMTNKELVAEWKKIDDRGHKNLILQKDELYYLDQIENEIGRREE